MDTNDKEKMGETALKEHRIFDAFFPFNVGYKKITDKKFQMAGVDYEIYQPDGSTIYVDLKCGIGPDYSMKSADYIQPQRVIGRVPAVALEISQYGEFTNTKGKLTDYFIYYILDDFSEAFYLFSFEDIRKLCQKDTKYTRYKSFNGTGVYIKVPAEKYALKSINI